MLSKLILFEFVVFNVNIKILKKFELVQTTQLKKFLNYLVFLYKMELQKISKPQVCKIKPGFVY